MDTTAAWKKLRFEKKTTCHQEDIAALSDNRVEVKEAETLYKYLDLAWKFKKNESPQTSAQLNY